jgi:hypothetical protein
VHGRGEQVEEVVGLSEQKSLEVEARADEGNQTTKSGRIESLSLGVRGLD